MYSFEIGKLKYVYLVGLHTIGIITPSRQRHVLTIEKVRAPRNTKTTGILNGTSDARLTVEEIVAYVLKHKLL